MNSNMPSDDENNEALDQAVSARLSKLCNACGSDEP